jgi:putative tricarboxylic transport membrane protein
MPTDTSTDPQARGHPGGAVVAALMVLFGCFVLWDTLSYTDGDSSVFPRACAITLIVVSLAYIVVWLLGYSEPDSTPAPGQWWRRLTLVAIMLVGTLAMPLIGFLPAALPIFGALLLVAMHDQWTPFRMIVYPLVGLAIVFGFFYIFQELLQVQLPTARLY